MVSILCSFDLQDCKLFW